LQFYISAVSLAMSAISFCLFVYLILRRPAAKESGAFGDAVAQGEIEGLAKLAEALAKLVESVQKAGPVALCFVSSIVFVVVSLIAARG
jgi:hypothetical protein